MRCESDIREPSVATVLADPAASRALKMVLRSWLARDAVDAAHDAECLAGVLHRRATGRVTR